MLPILAGIEALLVCISIAVMRKRRRNLQEMQSCNQDLADALTLAAHGHFHEAEKASLRWQHRLWMWKAYKETGVWKQDKRGKWKWHGPWWV